MEKHEAIDMEKEARWLEHNAAMQKLIQEGVEAAMADIPNLEQAFVGEEPTLCCMDEGTPMGNMRSAGSGILTEGEERTAFVGALKAAGVKEVTSHAGCGAAALYRKRHGLEKMSVDDVAIEQAKRMAAELGVPYKGHITDLQRPAEFHHARVVYVDATGRFNPARLKELPPGFVVSRRYMTPAQALEEVRIAMSIAFGDHGFGNKFSSREPLLIMPITDATEGDFDADVLRRELEQISDERVKVDGFIRPVASIALREGGKASTEPL